jgi:hypothetical protein
VIDKDLYLDAAQLMESQGGSFARYIAKAYFAADSDNTQRLLKAFPDLFLKYRRMAEEDARRQAE